MANAYVIEIAGSTVGIVAPDGRGVRFHTALRRFHPMDGLAFRSPHEAERAARKMAADRKGRAAGNTGDFARASSGWSASAAIPVAPHGHARWSRRSDGV